MRLLTEDPTEQRYKAVDDRCANCGRPHAEHKPARDAKPPRCPVGKPPKATP